MTAEMITAIFSGLTGLLVAYLAFKTAQMNVTVNKLDTRVETVKATADDLRADVATVHRAVNSGAAEAARLLADANDRLVVLAATGVVPPAMPRPEGTGATTTVSGDHAAASGPTMAGEVPEGTVIPAGTMIPPGTVIPEGTVIPPAPEKP